MHGIAVADDIWFTCCAFHNMLLSVDGLNKRWNMGVQSPFEGELGWHELGDVEAYAPLIFRRVRNGVAGNRRQLDSSQIGPNPDNLHIDPHVDVDNNAASHENIPTSITSLMTLTNRKFRKCLVVSFHQRWSNKSIVWPSRNGVME